MASNSKISKELFDRRINTMLRAASMNCDPFDSAYDYEACELEMHKAPKAFSKFSHEKNPIFIGFEWELTFDFEQSKYIKKVLSSPCKNFINLRDGGDPIEVVSVPASLAWLKCMMRRNFFAKNFHDKLRATSDSGIHVHISKKAFDKVSLEKFIIFISAPENKDFIEDVAGRSTSNLWCMSNPLKKPLLEPFTGLQDYTVALDANLRQQDGGCGKGCAVNSHTDFPTIELRIFSGSKAMPDFFHKLEFAEAAVYFTRKYEKKDLTPDTFKVWLKKNRRRYPNLCKKLSV